MDGSIQDFSSGYYAVKFRVTPFADGPIIDQALFEYIREHLYPNTDAPMWMRIGLNKSPYFRVSDSEPMPTDILGMPPEWMEDFELPNDNERHWVYICKPPRAHHISSSVQRGNTYEREDE